MDALESLQIADVGPRAVLGHEFGHHTYFTTHSRGLALHAKRVLQGERTFYEVGDCSFDSPGHHGTPNQRLRAAQWGADLAASAHKQGHILPSLTVANRFDAALPALVAPDAS